MVAEPALRLGRRGAIPQGRAEEDTVRTELLIGVVAAIGVASAGAAEIDIRKGGSLWARVEADGAVRIDGSIVGKLEADGAVRVGGSIAGAVEEDGTIRRDGSIVGAVESDGTLRKEGSVIGEIEDDGTIRRDGSIWGSAEGCCPDHPSKRAVAAVLTFFSDAF
jgi:cytoskeletal protein CcmA (bactofilin family)